MVQILFDNLGKLQLSDTREAIATMPNSTTVLINGHTEYKTHRKEKYTAINNMKPTK